MTMMAGALNRRTISLEAVGGGGRTEMGRCPTEPSEGRWETGGTEEAMGPAGPEDPERSNGLSEVPLAIWVPGIGPAADAAGHCPLREFAAGGALKGLSASSMVEMTGARREPL